jgi:ATP-dependent DNA helicase RecG
MSLININPAPPSTISLQQLNSFNAPSNSRNPILAFVFNKMGYMEETGLGMAALKSLNEKYGLPLPEYKFLPPLLTLSFPKTLKSSKSSSNSERIKKLNDEELIGFEYIKLHGTIKRKDYEDKYGYDKKKAERHLNKMVDIGIIERKGSGPNTYYEIIAT